MKLIAIFAFLLSMEFSPVQAQADTSMFAKKVFVDKNGDSLQYRILFPEQYESGGDFPLVLFMHGAGERGGDNSRQLTHGAEMFLNKENRKKYPAIVVFPQCPKNKYWVDSTLRQDLFAGATEKEIDFKGLKDEPTDVMQRVMALHHQLVKNEKVDQDRLYLMGLSMGGFATYEMLGRWPKTFAGAVAVCGGGNLEMAERYAKRVPIWITHGTKDSVVPVKYSQRMYEKLQEEGAEVKYTEFPDYDHNSWEPTFAMPELLPWLFAQEK